MTEIIGAIALLSFLWGLSKTQPGAPHPTGEKPEPGPSPEPSPQPSPAPSPGPSVTPHGGGPAPSRKPTPAVHIVPVSAPAAAAPTPWPQAVPKGLPAFPSGWEPDVPVQADVAARAAQLIPELWKTGKPGRTKQEMIGDHWVTFLGFIPAKGKKGVAAYRTKAMGTAMTL